jgi:hypothetical protein
MAAGVLLYHAWQGEPEAQGKTADAGIGLPSWKMPWLKHGIKNTVDVGDCDDRPGEDTAWPLSEPR